jgi:hypothetical protein
MIFGAATPVLFVRAPSKYWEMRIAMELSQACLDASEHGTPLGHETDKGYGNVKACPFPAQEGAM